MDRAMTLLPMVVPDGVDSAALGGIHLSKGGHGDQQHRQQQGQETLTGVGQAGILDEDVIHAVGIGLLHATNELGIGLDPLLLRPLPQQEVGTEEAHEADDQTPDDGHTQIAAEHQSDGQDGRGGRHQTRGSGTDPDR